MTSPPDVRNRRRTLDADDDASVQAATWASSGAMAITGWPGSDPVGPPAGMVPKLEALADRLRTRAAALGGTLDVEPLGLLGERAAIGGLTRRGNISCGGTTRLLQAADCWFAVSLARPEDIDLVPAWLEVDELAPDVWSTIVAIAAATSVDDVVGRGVLMGLPIGLLPASPPRRIAPDVYQVLPVGRLPVAGPPTPASSLAELTVLDLSSLWAGPLCGSLLAAAGASVIKIESTARPDGARFGPTPFFDLLNVGKRSVALDLDTHEGVSLLRDLVASADVVIEASRPRALEQLGIDAAAMLAGCSPRVWASITGHGRSPVERHRVAFGDDAAVAGGLVCWTDRGPVFCADAVADPTTGLVAAAAILDALACGGRWLLDISMAEVAASLGGPTLPTTDLVDRVAAPRARQVGGRGPRLGEHTAEVRANVPR